MLCRLVGIKAGNELSVTGVNSFELGAAADLVCEDEDVARLYIVARDCLTECGHIAREARNFDAALFKYVIDKAGVVELVRADSSESELRADQFFGEGASVSGDFVSPFMDSNSIGAFVSFPGAASSSAPHEAKTVAATARERISASIQMIFFIMSRPFEFSDITVLFYADFILLAIVFLKMKRQKNNS